MGKSAQLRAIAAIMALLKSTRGYCIRSPCHTRRMARDCGRACKGGYQERRVSLNTPHSTPSRAAMLSFGIGIGEIKTCPPATLEFGSSFHHPQPPPPQSYFFQLIPHYFHPQFEPSSTCNLFCDFRKLRNSALCRTAMTLNPSGKSGPPILLETPACLHVTHYLLL